MARVSPLTLLPPVLFAALAALFYFGMFRDNPDALPSARVGQVAPAMDLTALGSKTPLKADDLTGEGVKLVNYWASWCAPCRVEHPTLELLQSEGVRIFGINYKDDPANGLAFLEELGDPYEAVAADPSGRTALNWGVYGVPETYVIDGDGKVVLRHAGPVTSRVLETTIRPAMEKAAR